MSRLNNLLEIRFGRLLVVERLENDKYQRASWRCKCDCGSMHNASGGALLKGFVRSCGCLKREMVRKRNYRHGKSHTKFFNTWQSIKERCSKPYPRYSLRGIKCEWASFDEFHRDMWEEFELKYEKGKRLSIDRIDNNGNYSKYNCRWVDDFVQANNKSDTHYIEYGGKKQSITLWSRELGVPQERIRARLKLGYSIEEALTLKRFEKRT